jgi:hypothetical protein
MRRLAKSLYLISLLFHFALYPVCLLLIAFCFRKLGFSRGLLAMFVVGIAWWLLTLVTTTVSVALVRLLDPTFNPENIT